jgi:pimeloyl-ACP methyl ester carboxylesterase
MVISSLRSFDGVPIVYETQGEGSPAIVFVHGAWCNRTHWENQTSTLLPVHQVVALDLAGHGESGTNRDTWSLSNWGKDVQVVAETLDLGQIVLVGHSLGAAIALEATLLMPDRVAGVVAVDGLVYGVYRAIRQPDAIAASLAPFQEDFRGTVESMVRNMFVSTSDPALVERVVRDVSSTSAMVGIPLFEALLVWDVEEVLPKVPCPVRCICSEEILGTFDTLPVVEQLHVTMMPNVGHFVMLEDPGIFNQRLLNAIQDMVG